jgi:tetraacyldisaccharide 4'-kinase
MSALEWLWYGDSAGSRLGRGVLWPLEQIYTGAVRLRGRMYDRGLLEVAKAPVPVLAIGNVSVGGTGKTPVTAWAVARLRDLGARPAVVLRGYGDDEPLVHRRLNPDALVVCDADRVRGARMAHVQGADCVVLDDAFQHRRLARTAEARASYERALALARQAPERRFLERRLRELPQ